MNPIQPLDAKQIPVDPALDLDHFEKLAHICADQIPDDDAGRLAYMQANMLLRVIASYRKLRDYAHTLSLIQPDSTPACERDRAMAEQPRRWFSYDGEQYETHDTEAAARKAAENALEAYREDAPDGWADEVEQVAWGVVKQEVEETLRRPRRDDDPCSRDCDEFVDYALRPEIRSTPAPEPPQKPEIGIECDRCHVAWVGENVTDAYRLGWATGSPGILCPDCAKPAPVLDEEALVGDLVNRFRGIAFNWRLPSAYQWLTTNEYAEFARAALAALRENGWGDISRMRAALAVASTVEEENQRKRAEKAERERDEWESKVGAAPYWKPIAQGYERRAESAESRLGIAVEALKRFANWLMCERHGDPDNSGQCISCGMPEDFRDEVEETLRQIEEKAAGEGNNSGASGVMSAGSSPTSRPPQMVDNQSGTANPPTGKTPSPVLPPALAEAIKATDGWIEGNCKLGSPCYRVEVERDEWRKALAEKDAEIERLQDRLALAKAVTATIDSLKPHAFVGSEDRACELCNRPDRDPIHDIEAVKLQRLAELQPKAPDDPEGGEEYEL